MLRREGLFDLVLCQKDGNVVCFGSAIVGEVASTSATSGEPPNASRGASASEVSSGDPKGGFGLPTGAKSKDCGSVRLGGITHRAGEAPLGASSSRRPARHLPSLTEPEASARMGVH